MLAVRASRGGLDAWLWGAFAEFRFSGPSWPLLLGLAGAAALELLMWLPLGFCARMAVAGGAPNAWYRPVAAGLGLCGAWVAAFVLAGWTGGAGWHAPGLLELLLPASGSAIGILLAGAFQGPSTQWRSSLALRGVTLLLAGGLTVAAGAHWIVSDAPPPGVRAQISSDEKRALVAHVRRAHPLRVPNGEHVTLALSIEELESLLAWGVLLVDPQDGRAAVRGIGDELVWRASVALPPSARLGGYLTAGGAMVLSSDGQRLRVTRCRLSLGSLSLGRWSCAALLRSLHRWAFSAGVHRAVLAPVESVSLDAGGLAVTYGRLMLDEPLRERLQTTLGPGWEVRAATRAQYALLREEAERLADTDDHFMAVLRAAFALAAERSAWSTAVAENQGAILALATVFGHRDVATMAGVERPDDLREIQAALPRVRLRGRADWTQHFLVSAAITQAATAIVSDAAGLLKEELDAVGRSGFSFGDLLADRAGTVFGEAAARDEATARWLQRMVVEQFDVDSLMPPGDDLPERITDEELTLRYGGVGGPLYLALMADIEARIAKLPAARALAGDPR